MCSMPSVWAFGLIYLVPAICSKVPATASTCWPANIYKNSVFVSVWLVGIICWKLFYWKIYSEWCYKGKDTCSVLLNVQHITEATRLNYEQNMHDAIAVFPRLQTGLDVNVKFTGFVYIIFGFSNFNGFNSYLASVIIHNSIWCQ